MRKSLLLVGFWAIGLCATTALAQTPGAMGAQATAPTIESLPARADTLFAQIDGRAELSGVAPLRKTAVDAGDVAVRFWFGFPRDTDPVRLRPGMTLQAIFLRRERGVWSARFLMPVHISVQASDFAMGLPEPKGGWEKLWRRLQEHRLLSLPDQPRQGSGDVTAQIGDDRYEPGSGRYVIEVVHEGVYRAYAYDNPAHGKSRDDREMFLLARTLRDAFPEDQLFSLAAAGIAPLPPDAEQHLLHDTFAESRDAAAIPDWVRQVVWERRLPQGFKIANPGEEWQWGDYATKPGLPTSRLRFVATAGDYCVLAYEKGGFVESRRVLFLHRTPDKPMIADVYQDLEIGNDSPQSLAEVREAQKKSGILRVRGIAL